MKKSCHVLCMMCCTILTLTASLKHEPSVCVQRWMSWSTAEAARCCQCESFAQRLWYERAAASSSAASVCESTAASNLVSSACTDYNHTKQWHMLTSKGHWTIFLKDISIRVLNQELVFDFYILRTRYNQFKIWPNADLSTTYRLLW